MHPRTYPNKQLGDKPEVKIATSDARKDGAMSSKITTNSLYSADAAPSRLNKAKLLSEALDSKAESTLATFAAFAPGAMKHGARPLLEAGDKIRDVAARTEDDAGAAFKA